VFYANQGEENSGYVTDAFLRSATAAAGVDLAAAQNNLDAAGVLARTGRSRSARRTGHSLLLPAPR
jgi:hypothetical protein